MKIYYYLLSLLHMSKNTNYHIYKIVFINPVNNNLIFQNYYSQKQNKINYKIYCFITKTIKIYYSIHIAS